MMTEPTVTTRTAEAARRNWETPEVRSLRAGSAEAGPNPNVAEGAFARGS